MAIYHCQMKPLSRRSGRSAVAAAAYRAGENLRDERQGMSFDFSKKGGVLHTEIVLPAGVDAVWARDRATLWNTVEAVEKRRDARTAREFELALPTELDPDARRDLALEFARRLADTYRVAVDVAVHAPSRDGDERNHHAHLLCTTREVGPDGLGQKTMIETRDAVLKERGQPSGAEQLKALRQTWADLTNRALERAGHDERVDHRSHRDRDLKIEPSRHEGVRATNMRRRGWQTERQRLDDLARSLNAQTVRERPEQLLELVTAERSVFDRFDIERAMWRCSVDRREIAELAEVVIAAPETILVQREPDDMPKGSQPARYSTREMIDVETRMAADVVAMKQDGGFAVPREHVDRGIAAFDAHLATRGAALADEQREVVEYLADESGISVVVGHAGAGKSTTLAAARFAWESAGHRVLGAALAGKAADSLQKASGISARTLASWEAAWSRGEDQLERGDILIIDEAGMVCARQMGRVVAAARNAGAKLIMVGDAEQLQAIGPGASFRVIADRVGAVGLEVVRRQTDEWQRAATRAFAAARTVEGLRAYADHKRILGLATAAGARAATVKAYTEAKLANPHETALMLAHRRADVANLAESARAVFRREGLLDGPDVVFEVRDSDDISLGEKAFAVGDEIMFLKNDRKLAVKNGTGARVTCADREGLDVVTDDGRRLRVDVANYDHFTHGYAVTIHKSQGATYDRTFVLASDMMDRHLTYVSLSRHRLETTMFADRSTFGNFDALASHLSRVGLKESVLDYFEDPNAVMTVSAATTEPARQVDDVEQVLERLGIAAREAFRAVAEKRPVPKPVMAEWTAGAEELGKIWEGADGIVSRIPRRDATFRTDVLRTSDNRELARAMRGAIERGMEFEVTPDGRAQVLATRWERVVARLRSGSIDWPVAERHLESVRRDADADPGAVLAFATGTARMPSGQPVPDEICEGLAQGQLSDRLVEAKRRHREQVDREMRERVRAERDKQERQRQAQIEQERAEREKQRLERESRTRAPRLETIKPDAPSRDDDGPGMDIW